MLVLRYRISILYRRIENRCCEVCDLAVIVQNRNSLARRRAPPVHVIRHDSQASQDGFENIHDSFRRKSGSYQRVIAALRAAVTAGLSVRLSTVVTQVNVDDLRNIVRIAEDVGIYGVEFKRFRPAGNGVARKTDYSLQPEQETGLRETIEELKKISPLAIQLVYGAEPGGPDLGCPCGTRSITLRPNGDIAPCAYSEHIIGNAMATPLSQIWRDSQLLNSMRTAGGCVALTINRNPSNPVLSAEGHYAGSEKIAT